MSRLKHYVGGIVFGAIVMVLFVVVSLDLISDLVDQLGNLKGSYDFVEAVIYVLLYLPSSTYDFVPLAALVGCLIGLGMLASSSELTVMRAAGVSILQVVWIVFRPVFVIVAFGTLIGEFVAPYLDQYADSRRALAQGHTRALESDQGLWNREGDEFMHFNAVLPNGKVFGITRYKFDASGNLVSASFVDSAIYQGGYWFEQEGRITYFNEDKLETRSYSSRRWDTELTPDLLTVLVLAPDELPMQALHNYAKYLDKQGLDSSDYRLAFWQKALQPLATLSLVTIAISFILGPLRQVTTGFRVFIGVLVGLVFQTSQKLLGPTSIILGFAPIYAVLLPIVFCFFCGWVMLKQSE